MDNVIKYYYNLNIDEIKEHDSYSIFKSENKIYVFKKYDMDKNTLKYIVDFLYKNNININKIIVNKENEIFTKYNNNEYVLIYINNFEYNNDIIIDIPIKPLNNIEISKMWEYKLNNYMENINELGLNKKVLIDTFNYYIGLAENAVSLYNDALNINENISYIVSHKRMKYPNLNINFLDPTSMLIDYRIRDISEYIKYKFYYDRIDFDEIDNIFKKYNLTIKEINLLYARLFYPTFYFDIFEDNIISDDESRLLKEIQKKRISYEKFLYDFYLKYKSIYNIPYVKWLSITQRL